MISIGKLGAFVLLVSGIVLPEIVGYQTEGYSSQSNYLSELGAIDARFSHFVNYFGFLPVGLAVITLVFVLSKKLPHVSLVRAGLICMLGVAVGYLGAVVFPCDNGCPSTGGVDQGFHNVAGLFEIIGATTGLFLLYFGCRTEVRGRFPLATLAAAVVVTVGFLIMLIPEFGQVRGLTQRLADYTIFVWFSYAVLKVSAPVIPKCK